MWTLMQQQKLLPHGALRQSLPHLLNNLLRNPVEPESQTLSGIASHFSATLLNLTWLCTQASQTSWTSAPKPSRPSPEPPPEPDLSLHQSLQDLLGNLLRNLRRNPVELHPPLHQSLPDLLRNLLRNLVEPDAAPAPVHTGAILGWRPH